MIDLYTSLVGKNYEHDIVDSAWNSIGFAFLK